MKRKPIILCIDDNPDWLLGLQELLGEEEYEVLVASDGPEGLELYDSQPVDAVIVDYQMPEMTGDRVAAQMKLAKPDVPIVLFSGHDWLPEDVSGRICYKGGITSNPAGYGSRLAHSTLAVLQSLVQQLETPQRDSQTRGHSMNEICKNWRR